MVVVLLLLQVTRDSFRSVSVRLHPAVWVPVRVPLSRVWVRLPPFLLSRLQVPRTLLMVWAARAWGLRCAVPGNLPVRRWPCRVSVLLVARSTVVSVVTVMTCR